MLIGLVVASLIACSRTLDHDPPIRVAAAADLMFAFEALVAEHGESLGAPVAFSFGSSGLLAQQIERGAPYDVYASANVRFVDQVIAAGACDGATKLVYGRGRLAAWTRAGSVKPPATLAELDDPRFSRIAIANPEHAPYGQAAREALEHAGLWDALAPRLVYGENIRQAQQYAQTGNVELALVALALVIDDGDNPWSLIAERRHEPIDQALVVCARGKGPDGGQAFAALVASKRGREVMRRFGFARPGETDAPSLTRHEL